MSGFELALISPGREGSVVSGRWKGVVNFYRLTLPLLAGLTPRKRYRISVFDECVDRVPVDRSFDLVALSVMTPYAPRAYELAKRFRASGAKVVLGGQHPTLLPHEAVQHADAVVVGDAESTWPQVLADFESGSLSSLYRADRIGSAGSERTLPDRSVTQSKSALVFSTVETSRGCPYVCDYCTIASFYKSDYGRYSFDTILADIESIPGKYVFFVDDNFIGGSRADRTRTKALLRELKGLKKRWLCQSTVLLADDEELLQAAAAAGCVGVYLGLESVSSESLKEVRKGWNKPEAYVSRIGRIRAAGVAIEAGLIFGFDHDDSDVFQRTAEFVYETGIESPNAHILTPYPGTPLFARYEREARILHYDWSSYNTGNVVFRPSLMTSDELAAGYEWWYKEVFSPRRVLSRVRKANFSYYAALVNLVKAVEVRRRGFSCNTDKVAGGEERHLSVPA